MERLIRYVVLHLEVMSTPDRHSRGSIYPSGVTRHYHICSCICVQSRQWTSLETQLLMIIMCSKTSHIHCQFRIRFLFGNRFYDLIRINRINFFNSCMLLHRFFNRWELNVKIKTYIKYFVVRTHRIIWSSVITIYMHFQFWEFFSISFFSLIDFSLLFLDVIIILVSYDHLSGHTLARSDFNIGGVIRVSSRVTR